MERTSRPPPSLPMFPSNSPNCSPDGISGCPKAPSDNRSISLQTMSLHIIGKIQKARQMHQQQVKYSCLEVRQTLRNGPGTILRLPFRRPYFVVINTSYRFTIHSSMHFLTALSTARSFLYRDAVSMERCPVSIAIYAGSHSDSEARNARVFEGARIVYPKPRMGIRKPDSVSQMSACYFS